MDKYFYTQQEWKNFRMLCLKRAGHCCERCGDADILQVHHVTYVSGKKPWEYPLDYCKVLCRKCHAEVHGLIPPSRGWIIVDSDVEKGQPSDPIPCDRCETPITWHFTVWHPDHGERIVGSECAKILSLDDEIDELLSFKSRCNTFITSKRWKLLNDGCVCINQYYDSIYYSYIKICCKGNFFNIKINDRYESKTFRTLDGAKRHAFFVTECDKTKRKLRFEYRSYSR